MIELLNIHKQLDGLEILKDLSLTLEDGKFYGLVGPNGVGKSTLLRVISGVLIPEHGIVLIDEKDFSSDHRLKKDIIYVSDDPYFFGMNTLKELRQFYHIFYTSFSESVYYRLINLFQVNEKAPLSSFSKGMKRQASLIIGLALDPKVLLLDETFDGLDPVMRMNLLQYLQNQVKEKNLTVFIASHGIRDLEDICDHICLLYEGQITDMGNKNDPQLSLHAYRMKFSKPINLKEIETLSSVVHYEINGKELFLVLNEERGNALDKLKLLSCEEETLTMEDVFIYTLKGRGYGKLI
jgi:ABC-type multidrug transport system, ATPase component